MTHLLRLVELTILKLFGLDGRGPIKVPDISLEMLVGLFKCIDTLECSVEYHGAPIPLKMPAKVADKTAGERVFIGPWPPRFGYC